MLDPLLLSQVRPSDWVSPTPARLYDLVVLGGGTAGLVSAVGAAGLGARVALVERAYLGGDCLMTGCIPSKALLRSARAVDEGRRAGSVGVPTVSTVDFAAVMAHVHARQASLAPHDSAERLRGLGVHVFFGDAAFSGRRTLLVDERTLRFRRAVIATGTRAAVPDIPGLDSVPYLTNESVFNVTACPKHLVVLGGGPVGCELAQAFALLGSRVTLIETAPRILPKEDPDASAVLATKLADCGVKIRTSARVDKISPASGGALLSLGSEAITCDQLLIATGRRPNVEGLNLDRAGVRLGDHGVDVDDHLRTANRRIFAAGDICSPLRFTHAADAAARIVVRNALFFGRQRVSRLVVPRCVYTSPEIAHVGVEAAASSSDVKVITVPLADVDRPVVDDEREGFVRVYHIGGRLVGATVVAPHAGEVIGLLGLCIQQGTTLSDLSSTIFPYPTVAEALRKAGDSYRREGLTPSLGAWLTRYFGLLRWD